MSDHTFASPTPELPAPTPAPSTPMPQNATECTVPATRDSHLTTPAQTPTTRTLSEKHRIAIDMILAGESDYAIYNRLKIDRSTLYRWKHHNPNFIAEMNRRHQEIWSDFSGDLRLSIAKAIRALDLQLESVNPVVQHRAARTMLTLVNSDRISPKNVPTRVDDVLDTFLRAAQPVPTSPPANGKDTPPPTFTDAQRQALLDRLLAEEAAAESTRQAAAAERSALYHQRRQHRAQLPRMENGQSPADNGQMTNDQGQGTNDHP